MRLPLIYSALKTNRDISLAVRLLEVIGIHRTLSILTYSLDGLELMFVGIGFICVPIAMFLYSRINAKREAELQANGGISKYTMEQTHELGDRAPDFRYTL